MAKSFENIKKDADINEYRFIASCLQLSVETVRKVVSQHRKDNHHVDEAFTILQQGKKQLMARTRAKITKLQEKTQHADLIYYTDGTKD